ncbi:MAG: hypothetical protein IT289_08115 [Oligoflexia bacterium]|nr:hypothetical protein [Oligoflexia bacterium]
MKRLRLVLAAALLTAMVTGCEETKTFDADVWFFPTLGSEDLSSVIFSVGTWSKSYDKISHFGFQVKQWTCMQEKEQGCELNKRNVYMNFKQADIFAAMNNWGKKISLIGKAIGQGEDPCGVNNFFFHTAFQNVQDTKGEVKAIMIDRPLETHMKCGRTFEKAAKETADFMSVTFMLHGSVFQNREKFEVGIHETLGKVTVAQIKDALPVLMKSNSKLYSLHIEVPRQALNKAGWTDEQIVSSLNELKEAAAGHKVKFGYVITGETANTDKAYYESALANAEFLKAKVGMPQSFSFYNWKLGKDEDGSASLSTPLNTGENDAHTHTALIKSVVTVFSAP